MDDDDVVFEEHRRAAEHLVVGMRREHRDPAHPCSSSVQRAASLRPRSATYSSSSSTDAWFRARCSACTKNGQTRSSTMRARSACGDRIGALRRRGGRTTCRRRRRRWRRRARATTSSSASDPACSAGSRRRGRARSRRSAATPSRPSSARASTRRGGRTTGASRRAEHAVATSIITRSLLPSFDGCSGATRPTCPTERPAVERAERDRDVDAVVVGKRVDVEPLEQRAVEEHVPGERLADPRPVRREHQRAREIVGGVALPVWSAPQRQHERVTSSRGRVDHTRRGCLGS